MKLTGNTILITGGGSGIGRGLAEALHKLGNEVIISGRRRAPLEETIQANPGMQGVELNVADPKSIAAVTSRLVQDFPKLNVLINNAGMMKMDDVAGAVDDEALVSTLTTNVMGPIRMTAALIEHFKKQESATVIYTTSGLAFTPLAPASVYCATKAAMHSYLLSQRYALKGTSVKVLEIAPPYVQTELTGAEMKSDPRAMPLDDFIQQTMAVLGTDSDEVLVEGVKMLRNNVGPNEWAFVDKFNDMFAGH